MTKSTEPVWVKLAAVLQIHSDQLAEFGGLPGVRDRGAVESALARPQHLFAYGEPDLYDLAAAYISRQALIALFLALLEMVRLHAVVLRQ